MRWRRRRSWESRRSPREIDEEARAPGRRRRTEVLDLGLELCGAWLRDLVAIGAGRRSGRLQPRPARPAAPSGEGARPRPGAARRSSRSASTRRRLDLNVSEELALEALFFRLERCRPRLSPSRSLAVGGCAAACRSARSSARSCASLVICSDWREAMTLKLSASPSSSSRTSENSATFTSRTPMRRRARSSRPGKAAPASIARPGDEPDHAVALLQPVAADQLQDHRHEEDREDRGEDPRLRGQVDAVRGASEQRSAVSVLGALRPELADQQHDQGLEDVEGRAQRGEEGAPPRREAASAPAAPRPAAPGVPPAAATRSRRSRASSARRTAPSPGG